MQGTFGKIQRANRKAAALPDDASPCSLNQCSCHCLVPASHPGGDVHRVQAAGQGCLQVPQGVQALHFAVPAVDQLFE